MITDLNIKGPSEPLPQRFLLLFWLQPTFPPLEGERGPAPPPTADGSTPCCLQDVLALIFMTLHQRCFYH